jgi:hypothetical protein
MSDIKLWKTKMSPESLTVPHYKFNTGRFLKSIFYVGVFLVIGFFAFNFNIHKAAAVTCTSAATGNWNATATWGASGCSGATGGIPGSSDNVIIASSFTVTVPDTYAAAANSVTINSAAAADGLTLAGSGSLTIGGTVSCTGNSAGAAGLCFIANAAANAQTITLNGSGSLTTTSVVLPATITAGSASDVSKIICGASGTAAAKLIISGSGAAGTIDITGTSKTSNGGSSIDMSGGSGLCGITTGTGTTTITGGSKSTGPALLKIGTGTINIKGAVTLTNSAQSLFTTVNGSTITLDAAPAFTVGTNAVVTITASTNLTNNSGSSAWNIAETTWGTCTVTAGTLTFGAAQQCTSVSVANSATLTVNALLTVTGNFACAGTVSGSNGVTDSAASAQISSTGTCTVSASGTFTISGGTAPQITSGSTYSFVSLTISGPTTNNGTITVSTALAGLGAFINDATGTLNIGFAAAPAITTLTATASGNTVNYNRAGDQTVKAVSYNNLTLSNSGIKTMTSVTVIGGNLTISGSATMTGNAAFAVAGTLNYSSSGSTTLTALTAISIGKMNQTDGIIVDNANTISVTGTGAVWIESGTFTATGTISITDTSSTGKTFAGGNKTYKNLTISGAALAGAVTITGANTFDALTLNPNSTLTLTAGTTTTINSLSATGTAGNTITINSTGAYATFLNNTTNVTVHYCSITNNQATGSVTWDATDNCTSGGGNSGWKFPLQTSISIRAQNYTNNVTDIIFPEGASGTTVSQPYNTYDGSGSPQTFGGAGVAKPVVTLYNGSASTLTIWYNITTFTNGVASNEYYLINAKGAACNSADAITNAVTFGANTSTLTTIALVGYEKDLYLKVNLSSVAGKTGTSTLTILGEIP